MFLQNKGRKLIYKNRIGSCSGLPDGIFAKQKYQFWYILEGVGMEYVGVFYGHLIHLMAIWYIL
jgi:hypothetical protein